MRKILVVLFLLTCCITVFSKVTDVKVLYWNIQNGMWADQGNNYDNFVKYVNSVAPDVCVWCEAKTHYKTMSDESFLPTDDLYLPKHWDDLAARYGHKYVYVGGENDFFPQVITSKYPIENVERIVGSPEEVVVSHGAGWARLNINGKKVNIVTVHTWPQKFGFLDRSLPKEVLDASAAKCEGHIFRAKEMEYICSKTIGSVKNAHKQLWMMLGDMNSRSRLDNGTYGFPADSLVFMTQDYINQQTPYQDVVYKWFMGEFQSTRINKSRIDYVFCTAPLYKKIVHVEIVRQGYPVPEKLKWSKKGFCAPSDHLPIIFTFKL